MEGFAGNRKPKKKKKKKKKHSSKKYALRHAKAMKMRVS